MMSESIAVAFNSMISQSEFKDAISLIRFSSDKVPPPSVVNNLIFNVLMKNCERSIANEVNVYLHNYLLFLDKRSHSFPYDYRAVLQDISGVFADIWSVFSHLVKSSFLHYNISSNKERPDNFVKYPNCDILLEFYADMITKFLSLENDFFDDSEERFSILLEWINKAYKVADLRVPIFEILHLLLDNKMNYEISFDPFSQSIHAQINLILEKCPDVFSSARNMKGFFAMSKLPYFQVKICQHKLYQLIYNKELQENNQCTWTLKTILYNYFFHDISTVEVKKKTRASKKIVVQSSAKSPKQKKIFFQKNVTGDELDLKAADNVGLTPLHCAVYMDAVDIAQMLLKHEGEKLVEVKDKFDKKAAAYAKSKKMKDLLEEYQSTIPDSTSDTSPDFKENFTVPTMNDKEQYSIFLFGLFSILSHYLETYNLYGSKKDGVEKLSHKHRKCHHYVSQKSTAVCDEDASGFASLPHILDCFLACVQNDAKEKAINVRMDLLGLIVLGKRLANEA